MADRQLPFSADQLVWLARMVLGATLLLAGLAKLHNLPAFVAGALNYRVLPPRFVRPLARVLPFAEVTLGLALVAGTGVRLAALASLALLVIFALAVGINLHRGRSIPCHCPGASARERIGVATVTRLAILATAALVVAAFAQPQPAFSVPPGSSASDAVALDSMALSTTLLLLLLGPAKTLRRDVAALRQLARGRRSTHRGLRADGATGTLPNGSERLRQPSVWSNGQRA